MATELGTFTAGAQRVHVTQAAISMQIRQLENELGGQALYPRATPRDAHRSGRTTAAAGATNPARSRRRRNKLIDAIIKEEYHATEPMPRTFEIERTLEHLRKELEKEDAAYEYELKLLNSLSKQ